MTSNLGSDIIREAFENLNDVNRAEIVESTNEKVLNLLKMSLRPEFINRIDEIAVFEPLKRKHIRKVVQIQLKNLVENLKKEDIHLNVSEEALNYLAEEGYDPEFGARPVKRLIQRKVLNALSKELLHQRVQKGSQIVLDCFEKALIFRKPIKKDQLAEALN